VNMTMKFRHATGTEVAKTVVPKDAGLISREVVDDIWWRRLDSVQKFFQCLGSSIMGRSRRRFSRRCYTRRRLSRRPEGVRRANTVRRGEIRDAKGVT